MLASMVISLNPTENAILPPTMGHQVHAAFLHILRQVNTDIAERLHTDQSYKPFTVSPLQGKFDKHGKGKIFIRAGTGCWLRFTVLDDNLLAALTRYFMEDTHPVLRLGDNTFQVTKVTASENGKSGGWGGHSTFEAIFDKATPFDKLSVRFYSPTAFKVYNRVANCSQNYVFPDPLYCFHSWLKKWNAFSPIPVEEDELLDFIHTRIQFSRYSIRTRIMNFGGYRQLGFVGDCEYQFMRNGSTSGSDETEGSSPRYLKQVNALANFAFYCGTGYKTTMGMGQTRRQETATTREGEDQT